MKNIGITIFFFVIAITILVFTIVKSAVYCSTSWQECERQETQERLKNIEKRLETIEKSIKNGIEVAIAIKDHPRMYEKDLYDTEKVIEFLKKNKIQGHCALVEKGAVCIDFGGQFSRFTISIPTFEKK